MRYKICKLFITALTFSILYTMMISIQGCDQDFIQPGDFVRFPGQIEAELNALGCNANTCHNTQSSAGGLDLQNWERAMLGSDNGSVIIPYSGFWSHFTAIVNADTSLAPVKTFLNPQLDGIHKLPNDKVIFFMNWIDDGAKDAEGKVAFENVSKRLFITNQAADMFAVIDAERELVTRLIPVDHSQQLKSPHYIATDPQKNYLFITLISGGQVLKFSSDYPYTLLGAADVGLNPAHVVISTDGNTGYVSNFDASGNQRDLRKFDVNSMTVNGMLTDIRLAGSHGIALSEDGQILYAASQLSEWLFKINTSTFEIDIDAGMSPAVPPNGNGTGTIRPYDVKISPDGNYLFISCVGQAGSQNNSVVKVYNTSDLSFVKDITVGRNPLLMEFTPDGQQLWICNRNSNSISVIDVATQTNIQTIQNAGVQPHGVAFSPNGEFAFIANETLNDFNGHHPLVSSTIIGVNTIIRTSSYTLEERVLETASFPAGILMLE